MITLEQYNSLILENARLIQELKVQVELVKELKEDALQEQEHTDYLLDDYLED